MTTQPKRKREQLEDWLRRELATGDYRPHQRFFSQEKLKKLHLVSQATVTEAFKQLAVDGLIYFKPGSGTYVSPRRRVRQILLVSDFTRINSEFNDFYYAAESVPEAVDFQIVSLRAEVFMHDLCHLDIVYPQAEAVIFFRLPALFAEARPLLEAKGLIPVYYGSSAYRALAGERNAYYYDEQQLVDLAMERLSSGGHRKIGCLYPDYGVFPYRYRLYCDWLRRHGLEVNPAGVLSTPGNYGSYELVRQLDRRSLPFTALFCPFAITTAEAVQGLLSIGARIPEEVAVVGVGDFESEMLRVVHPALTTVFIDHAQSGRRIAQDLAQAVGSAGKSNLHGMAEIRLQLHASG